MTFEAFLALLPMLFDAAVLGALMPPLVALVNQPAWPSWAKALVALVSCIGVGTGTAWAAGGLSGIGWPAAVAVAFLATQKAYRAYWHDSGIAPWIEQITSPKPKTIEGQAKLVSHEDLHYHTPEEHRLL